jgi:4'-phosphopantetheinyl transferase
MRQLLCVAVPGTLPADWVLPPRESGALRAQLHSGTARSDELPRISLSHSGNMVACAVAWCAVGIDVEQLPSARVRDVAGLAALALSDTERQDLAALPESQRERELLSRWTMKEAWLKAHDSAATPALLPTVITTRTGCSEPSAAWSWTSPAAVLGLWLESPLTTAPVVQLRATTGFDAPGAGWAISHAGPE